MSGCRRTTLAMTRFSAADDPAETASATATASTSDASLGSAAIWAAVSGAGCIGAPATSGGRIESRLGSTATLPPEVGGLADEEIEPDEGAVAAAATEAEGEGPA